MAKRFTDTGKWHELDLAEPFPDPGCYALYLINLKTNRKRLVYIGTAKDVSKRLYHHSIYGRKLKFPHHLLAKVKYMFSNRVIMEKKLIKKLKPILNKSYIKGR